VIQKITVKLNPKQNLKTFQTFNHIINLQCRSKFRANSKSDPFNLIEGSFSIAAINAVARYFRFVKVNE